MNREKASSKTSSRVGLDGEAKRMVAYSKMRTVAVLKLEGRSEERRNVPIIV
jgi:hypothetical protein